MMKDCFPSEKKTLLPSVPLVEEFKHPFLNVMAKSSYIDP